MKSSKFNLFVVASLILCSALPLARAQWSQTNGVGPYDYTASTNWYGGVVNNLFTNPPVSGMEVAFASDWVLTNGLQMVWSGTNINGSSNINVTLRSDSATPRTLSISLGNFVRTNNTGGIITVGTNGFPLILNLYGSTRSIGGIGQAGTADGIMNVNAQIIDTSGRTNGVNLGGARMFTYLLNDSNSFIGPVNFQALRGGGFSSIKNIGAGPSAMGAPTDTTNGTVTAVDNTSLGSVSYLGTGDTTDRPFVWNLTGSSYAFQNLGSGKITFTGPWTLPYAANRTNIFTINAVSNHIQLDGWIRQTNGTLTNLVFKANYNTNRIILTCPTNNFRAFEFTNVVLAYNNIADAGLPCALGTNGVIVHRGNAGNSSSANLSGDGATLQYFGPSATNNRVIAFSGIGYNWGVDNAGTNGLTWTSDFAGVSTAGGTLPRYIHLNVYSAATMEVQGAVPDVTSGMATTVVVGNSAGSPLFNGGSVRLLNSASSFSGGIQVKYARTAQVMTLADSGTACSIGSAGGFYPSGLTAINLGSTDSQRGGVLSYVGTNNGSCNRTITLLGNGQGGATATIQNNSPNNSSLHLSDPGAFAFASVISNCLIHLGGAAVATNLLDTTIPNTPSGNASLDVNGSVWKLTATTHYYAGTTTVGGGTLLLEGSIGPGGDVSVNNNGVLGGNGTINNNVSVQAGGTLSPGTNAIGTLTINGNLTNSGSMRMELKASDGTSDLVTGVNTLVYGGTLSATNIAGTLTNGASFKLFTATTYEGAFSSISPTTPGSGLAWDLTGLTNNGTLKIVAGAATPPHIGGIAASGASVIISGTGGTASANYYVVSATNVALPLINWTRLATNVFDAGGNFNFTNVMSGPREFFRIELP